MISDRILPLLFAEIASRKSELCYQLNEFFQDFFHISSNIVSLDVIEMTFSIKNPRDVSNVCFSFNSNLYMIYILYMHNLLFNLICPTALFLLKEIELFLHSFHMFGNLPIATNITLKPAYSQLKLLAKGA